MIVQYNSGSGTVTLIRDGAWAICLAPDGDMSALTADEQAVVREVFARHPEAAAAYAAGVTPPEG